MWLKVFEFFVKFLTFWQFFTYIDQSDEAVVLRAGKYNRTIKPGLRWLIPFAIEDWTTVNVKPEPQYIDNQSVHGKDDWLWNFQIGIELRVTDPRLYLVENDETEDLIKMLVANQARKAVQGSTWRQVNNPDFIEGIKKRARAIARKRGAEIVDVVLVDLANGNADRLWHEGVDFGGGDE